MVNYLKSNSRRTYQTEYYVLAFAGHGCVVGKISAFQPQGSQFDPLLCQLI